MSVMHSLGGRAVRLSTEVGRYAVHGQLLGKGSSWFFPSFSSSTMGTTAVALQTLSNNY